MAHASEGSPFRLLDLPQEIQDKIYAEYLHIAEFKFDASRKSFTGQPSLAIERTCRKTFKDCRLVRYRTWPKTLVIHYKDLSDYRCIGTRPDDDEYLTFYPDILTQCRRFKFDNIRLHSDWNWIVLLGSLSELRIVEIDHSHFHIFEGNEALHHDVFDMLTALEYDRSFQNENHGLVGQSCFSSCELKKLSKLFHQRQTDKDLNYSIRVTCDHRLLRQRKENQLLLRTVSGIILTA